MENKLILRGHHLLCLQGFQGYGYDDKFIENMVKVNEKRKKDNTKVKIIDSADDLCKCCPNLKNDMCKNSLENKKIVQMDRNVLEKLPEKEFYNSKELFEIMKNIFNSKKSIENICTDCKWWDVCTFVQKINR